MKLLCAWLIGCCVLQAQAQQSMPFMMSLRTVAALQTPATDVPVELLILNSDSQPLTYDPPEILDGILQDDQRSWAVSLHPAQPAAAITIDSGRFISIPYVLPLPGDVSGRLLLQVSTVTGLRAVIDISQVAAPVVSPMASITTALKQKEAETLPATARIERTFANRFAFHEPIYFLYGPEAPAAKFQFSFKYRLIGMNSKFGDLAPPFRGFYFAYTQRSLWDLGADSSPFYDTSYMPELLYEWLAPDNESADEWFHWLGLQAGFRHESNGQAGDDSRALNIAYLRHAIAFGSLRGWHLVVSPRAFTYTEISQQNADIARYRGYGELQLTLARNNSLQLSIAARLGSDRGKGSMQIDLNQPIQIPLINLETYLQLQYFNGYGESLRAYDRKSSVWRVGLGFVR
ncbi:MAG: phospholipase A [Steroidobacteraceae bacterium]